MNPNSRYYMSWSDLHSAASAGDAERVRELLKKGVDPNVRDEYGWTPLHVAALNGRVDIVASLLEHRADPNAKNKIGETPLHKAASWGHVDVVRLLLEHGADPTVKNKDGDTRLDLARARGHREVVSLIEEFHMEGWLRRRREPSRPGAAPVRSVSVAVCEACCEAWRIISQVYGFVKEARAMTAKELDDLKDLFHIFNGSVAALEEAAAEVSPDAVRELVSARQLIELILPQLERGNPPPETISTIITMYHRINNLKQQLACRC